MCPIGQLTVARASLRLTLTIIDGLLTPDLAGQPNGTTAVMSDSPWQSVQRPEPRGALLAALRRPEPCSPLYGVRSTSQTAERAQTRPA
jgi:hypothetical protein